MFDINVIDIDSRGKCGANCAKPGIENRNEVGHAGTYRIEGQAMNSYDYRDIHE